MPDLPEQHISRGWPGDTQFEDACPCPQEPCGMVAWGRVDPACDQHTGTRVIRSAHLASECPGHRKEAYS